MLTTFYPPYNFGGDGIAVRRLARALVRRGHHVTVVHDADAYLTLSGGEPNDARPEADGVEVIGLRSGAGALSILLTQQLGAPVVNGRRIRRILAEGDYDVINYHNVSLIGGPGLLSYGSAVKLYTAHEHWLVCPTHVLWRHRREACPGRQCLRCVLRHRRPPQAWRYTGFLQRQLSHVDALIAFSEFSRAKHREFGLQRDMEVVPGFLPEEQQPAGEAPASEGPYFLFVGRLERLKGLHDLIPVFADHRFAELVVAGDGEEGAALRDQAARLKAAVRFLGRVPERELAPLYRNATAVVVPSLGYETFGYVLIEAFRQGTPVLARRIGPFPEIVERCGGGQLFTTRDELAAALRRLQCDSAHRQNLARAAYAGFVEHWTESAVVPRYLAVVRRVAQARKARRVLEALGAEAAA
jgi:glycosyltransferase involved in cell wall biosynthesis